MKAAEAGCRNHPPQLEAPVFFSQVGICTALGGVRDSVVETCRDFETLACSKGSDEGMQHMTVSGESFWPAIPES